MNPHDTSPADLFVGLAEVFFAGQPLNLNVTTAAHRPLTMNYMLKAETYYDQPSVFKSIHAKFIKTSFRRGTYMCYSPLSPP